MKINNSRGGVITLSSYLLAAFILSAYLHISLIALIVFASEKRTRTYSSV
jgi:membrane protein involved in colicin uptake